MKQNEMYSFFCKGNISTENMVTINIDNTLSSMQEIYDCFAKALYLYDTENYPFINFDGKCYLANNLDGFHDRLREYLFDNRNLSLLINITSKSNDISDNQIYSLMGLLGHTILECDFNIYTYVSKPILDVYLRESLRLYHLESKSEFDE